jgi:hypothetical protein
LRSQWRYANGIGRVIRVGYWCAPTRSLRRVAPAPISPRSKSTPPRSCARGPTLDIDANGLIAVLF